MKEQFCTNVFSESKLDRQGGRKTLDKASANRAAMKMLARSGHSMDELAAEAFSKNLQAHGTIDATITPFLT
jgi:hypothetical protein